MKKEMFLRWISENKLKNVSASDFVVILENIFFEYFKIDIWNIDDEKEFTKYRDELINNKEFKTSCKKNYNIFLINNKYYLLFLKNLHNNNGNDDSEGIEINEKSILKEKEENNNSKFDKIKTFFYNEKRAKLFYLLYEYSKKDDNSIYLDVRTTIIGVKIANEVFRYYCDKNGILKFQKNISKPLNIDDYEGNISVLFDFIDKTNLYFYQNKKAVSITYEETKNDCVYIYHIKFGFGKIYKIVDDIAYLLFDNINDLKKIKAGHNSYTEISFYDYENKIIPKQIEQNEIIDKKRVPWDKYETSLLIECFWNIENKKINRVDAVRELSSRLRRMAKNRGIEVDDYYRNENGISMQLSNIALAFFPDRPAMHRTALFDEMANLYLNNREQFDLILNEAYEFLQKKEDDSTFQNKIDEKKASDSVNIEMQFYQYMKKYYYSKGKSNEQAKTYARNGLSLAKNINKICDANLFNVNNKDGINKIYAVLKKKEAYINELELKYYIVVLQLYLNYINLKNGYVEKIDSSDYEAVIKDIFPEGFSFNNGLKKRKFIKRYEEIHNKPFKDDDEKYLKKINNIGFISEGKVYLTSIIPDEVKEEIDNYINSVLNNGNSAIYYSKLFESFAGKLNSIFTFDMFVKYIKNVFSGKYELKEDYISLKGEGVNLKQELINMFLNYGQPMNIEDVYASFPYLSHETINNILKDEDFITNARGKSYFYKDNFIIDDCDIDEIEFFIQDNINNNGLVVWNVVFNFISNTIPEIYSSNQKVCELGFKNYFKKLFRDKFSFSGENITSCDNNFSLKEQYEDFISSHEKFNLDDLSEFKEKMNCNHIDWWIIRGNSIRISQSEFVRKNILLFDIEKIDCAIEQYFKSDYISFNDIVNFTDFPTLLFNWNNYILESYVYLFSKKFKLIHKGFNEERPVGAIARKESNLNFDMLLIDVIKSINIYDKEKIYNYLMENYFIIARNVKNIDFLIDKARREK